jgi:hypothetical protein
VTAALGPNAAADNMTHGRRSTARPPPFARLGRIRPLHSAE